MGNMFDTVFFDLDGTLLQMRQDDFIKAYMQELGQNLASLGFDAQAALGAVWAGTKAMMLGNGSALNCERFWQTFTQELALDANSPEMQKLRAATDEFYRNEFDRAGRVAHHNPLSNHIVKTLRKKGYDVVLATNPLFPPDAVRTRLGWAGLDTADFSYITNYENSRYCKPNPDYFRELMDKLELSPAQVLMVGNNVAEDMVAGTLGCAVYLVTDFIENEQNLDYGEFPQGSLQDFADYVDSLDPLR